LMFFLQIIKGENPFEAKKNNFTLSFF
jgi:hypothetical protein